MLLKTAPQNGLSSRDVAFAFRIFPGVESCDPIHADDSSATAEVKEFSASKMETGQPSNPMSQPEGAKPGEPSRAPLTPEQTRRIVGLSANLPPRSHDLTSIET